MNTHFAPDYHYGGVVESASKIHKYVRRLLPFFVICVSKNPDPVNSYLGSSGICYPSIALHRFGLSFALIWPLWRIVKEHDLIVVNGIFTFPVTLAQLFAIIQKKRFIVSVRGGLEPWRLQHKKYRKAIFNTLITFPLLKRASCIHVTSEEEYNNLIELGFKSLKLITNGIDNELINEFIPKENQFFQKDKFVFLFLSRTDKEKGLDILLGAYSKFLKINNKSDHTLAIVGPDHQHYLRDMNINYKDKNIQRMEGIYGNQKYQVIYEAHCVVLPSYSENFGNIVAEGMGMSKPVITTTGTPWQILKEKNIGYYVDPTESAILAAMQSVYNLPSKERETMGFEARKYIIDNMLWSAKANEFTLLFNTIFNSGKSIS